MHLHSIVLHIESDIRHMQEIVREVLLDEIAFVSTTNDEVVDSVLRIHLENVPQDRSTADLDHRLWAHDGFFTEPRPEPARQYDCFHPRPLVSQALRFECQKRFRFICYVEDVTLKSIQYTRGGLIVYAYLATR